MKIAVLLGALVGLASGSGLRNELLGALQVEDSICSDTQSNQNSRAGDQDYYDALKQCLNDFVPPPSDEKQPNGCESLDRTSCMASGSGCQWIASMGTCVYNQCRFLNNGLCAKQVSSGCVWYKKGQAMGNNMTASQTGCYRNPCGNPVPNNSNGCAAQMSGDYTYSCAWCSNTNPKGCYSQTVTPCGKAACPNGGCEKCDTKKNSYCYCYQKLGWPPNAKEACPDALYKFSS